MVISAFVVQNKLSIVFLGILLFFLGINSSPKVEASPVAQQRLPQISTVFDLPSVWTDHNKNAFAWKQVSGQTTLVALIYTSCQMSCPLITKELLAIEQKLFDLERKSLRVLLFSFDPARDTVNRLKEYTIKHKLDTKRWTLLTGTDEGARELSVVLGIQFKKLQSGEFAHSNIITVLDQAGKIAYQQQELGKNTEEMLAAIRKVISTK